MMCSGVDDLFEMIQSRTFIYQLGYGIIKIFVVNVFAELRPLFRQMELSVGNESRGMQSLASVCIHCICLQLGLLLCIRPNLDLSPRQH